MCRTRPLSKRADSGQEKQDCHKKWYTPLRFLQEESLLNRGGMPANTNNLETLIHILEKSHQPQLLDSHPWTRSLMVRQAGVDTPELLKKSPGQRLVFVIARLFGQMMPANPPRRGKRLDTHWGEFGILAAQYFAPLLYGEPVPASLREAWGHIDQSILLFVYGKPEETLSEAEKEPYKLVGNELNIAPNSTLSDWHRNGLEHLIEMILRRESYLSGTMSKPAGISQDGQPIDDSRLISKPHKAGRGYFVLVFLGILLLGLLLFDGVRSWRIYKQVILVRQDVKQLRAMIKSPGSKLTQIKAAGPVLSTLRQDFATLKNQSQPLLWIGPIMSWIPVYGGDLASIQPMVNIADALLASADISYKALVPVLGENDMSGITPARLTEVLVQAQPQLIEADRQINLAILARSHMEMNRLTPDIRNLIKNDLDPLIDMLGDGLSIAEDLPRMMGATGEGPKSYLLLAQNEDELRPTGGFITAVGSLLVDNGQISNLTFVNSYDLDEWSKPYPAAPWQLQQYMDSSVLVLRDTSWFTNYPTAALYAETLYSYANDHTVDGVIAFDQQFLVEILGAVGPVELEGVAYPIDASNVIAYIRAAKTPSTADLESELISPTYITKAIYTKKIADALVEKILNGNIPPEKMVAVLLQALNERHLLLKMDSPSITKILARRRWDGAIRPDAGDFLMVVDTNIGFNKTNAEVQSSLVYDVDLTKPASPSGSLTVVHTNNAGAVICTQPAKNKSIPPGEELYLLTDCYWNYMRVYLPSGTKLLDATPQFVPANWMIIKQDVEARVDDLGEEIDGVQAFGTLQVVPGGESLVTSFRFSLPVNTVQSISGESIYHLLVQKQPGTQAIPITIRVHLPNKSSVKTAPAGAVVQNQDILYQTVLRTDAEFELVFQAP
jgi:hypothetical protein